MADRGPVLLRRRLGQLLRELRIRARLTGKDAGDAIDRSSSWVSRVEAGRVGIRTPELRVLLDLYGLNEATRREELEKLARAGHQRGWWSKYSDVLPESYHMFIGLEAEANALLIYENVVVPGLLQAADYCRAIIRQTVPLVPADHIEKRVAVRLARQQVLEKDDAPELQIVLDEAVLYRSIGGKEGFRAQLELLAAASQRARVSLRLLPFTQSEHIVLATSFTI